MHIYTLKKFVEKNSGIGIYCDKYSIVRHVSRYRIARLLPIDYCQCTPLVFISFFQVLNLVQSYVTLRVPLFVSYVFHSPVAVGGWQHFDLQSELKLTFVYDTAILWQDGIGSPPEAELQGMFLAFL